MSYQFRNLIIDGYNLIHAIPAIARYVDTDLRRARELLLIKLAVYSRLKQTRITVVFDGQNAGADLQADQPGLTVVFTHGRKADQEIKDRLSRITSKKDWLIITSDFDIRYFADGLMIKTQSSQEFAAELQAADSKGRKKDRPGASSPPEARDKKKPTREDLAWAYEVFLKNKK
ncbi:MAG: NYN domain-containing protein [Candidatus Saccharicenans sp.]|nr:NYN domain-containing protein [Candidatus Saccharicenans sp.]